jgi:drug/metabolite transporter (DMT)-like permease
MASVERQWFPLSPQGWLAIVGLAFICQIMGQGLVAYSLKRISAGAVATTFLLEPVFPALAAWWLFAEHLSLSNALAFGVVAVGIYLAVSSPSALDTGEGAGGVLLDPSSSATPDPPQEDQTP